MSIIDDVKSENKWGKRVTAQCRIIQSSVFAVCILPSSVCAAKVYTPFCVSYGVKALVVLIKPCQSAITVSGLVWFRFPCFENPYQMDLHESPVTSCLYFADCPHDLIPAFYSVGCRQKKTGYSEKVNQSYIISTNARCYVM